MEKYGLIGGRLDYSFSKDFFTEKFKQDNIASSYENVELKNESDLANFFEQRVFDFKGINVTIPYKKEVIPYLDQLSKEAKSIGAVNTIKVEGNQLTGHNTDAHGFQNSIKPFFRNTHERALILGTGGASRAVEYVLKKLGVDVCYLSRNPKKENEFSYADANQLMIETFKLIVNTTPLGTHPNIEEMPAIPIEFVGKDHLVIDLIYNPPETKLLRIAKANGADTMNGLSMLKHQALKAWDIWQS